MRKLIISFLCCLLLISASITFVKATPILTVTTAVTSSNTYDRYSSLTINGSLDYYNYAYHLYPSDGLVGLEIQDPSRASTVVRTMRTGTSIPNSITANIDSAYLCDISGNLQTSVAMPTADNGVVPYYYVHVINNAATLVSMLVTMNVYDSNNVPIALTYQILNIGPYSSSFVRTNFNIDSTAHYGTATAYLNVFSDWPSKGGIPYGLEQTFQFTITGGPAFSGTPGILQSANGDYNFSYIIPKDAAVGTYTVYTTSNYLGIPGAASTTFKVAQLGDLNSDGAVNFRDLTTFVSDYIAYFNTGVFNPLIDLNNDGKINFADLQTFVHDYIIYWST